jgi:hypothetical protein
MPVAPAVPQPPPEIAHLYQSVQALDVAAFAVELKKVPYPLLILAALAGIYCITLGARWFRPLAAGGGLVLGAGMGLAFGPFIHAETGLSPTVAVGALALVLAGLAAFYPAVFIFLCGAWPGALIGQRLAPKDDEVLGQGAGLVLGGFILVFFARQLQAVAASALGALLLGAAALGLSGKLPFLETLVRHPWVLVGALALLVVAGTAFQLAVHPERPKDKDEKEKPKGTEQSPNAGITDEEAKKRWEKYTKGAR